MSFETHEAPELESAERTLVLRYADACWQYEPAEVIGYAREQIGDAFAATLISHLDDTGWYQENGHWHHDDRLIGRAA